MKTYRYLLTSTFMTFACHVSINAMQTIGCDAYGKQGEYINFIDISHHSKQTLLDKKETDPEYLDALVAAGGLSYKSMKKKPCILFIDKLADGNIEKSLKIEGNVKTCVKYLCDFYNKYHLHTKKGLVNVQLHLKPDTLRRLKKTEILFFSESEPRFDRRNVNKASDVNLILELRDIFKKRK